MSFLDLFLFINVSHSYWMYFLTSLHVRQLEKGTLIIKRKQDNFILSLIHKQISFIQLSLFNGFGNKIKLFHLNL